MLNPEKNLTRKCYRFVHLTSVRRSHFTLGNPRTSFSTVLFIAYIILIIHVMSELQGLQLGSRHCDVGLTLGYVVGVVAGSKACRPIAGYTAVIS